MTEKVEIERLESIRNEALKKANSFYQDTFNYSADALVDYMQSYKIAVDRLKEIENKGQ